MANPRLISAADLKILNEDRGSLIVLKKLVSELENENEGWKKDLISAIDLLIKVEAVDDVTEQAEFFMKTAYSIDPALEQVCVAAKLTSNDLIKLKEFKNENAEDVHYQLAISKFKEYEAMVAGFEASLPRLEELKSKAIDLQADIKTQANNQKKIALVVAAYSKAIKKFNAVVSEAKSSNLFMIVVLNTLRVCSRYYNTTINSLNKFTSKNCLPDHNNYLKAISSYIDELIDTVKTNTEEFETIKKVRQAIYKEAAKQNNTNNSYCIAASHSAPGIKQDGMRLFSEADQNKSQRQSPPPPPPKSDSGVRKMNNIFSEKNNDINRNDKGKLDKNAKNVFHKVAF